MNFRDRVRFIEADKCPMQSRGGWLVPVPDKPKLSVTEIRARLIVAGFEENIDFRIQGQNWDRNPDVDPLKRVMFDTDEAFIMAKMTL